MPSIAAAVKAIAATEDWNSRVSLIRRIPEDFGKAAHKDVYSQIAKQIYVPNLAPDFAYVHWRAEYELGLVEQAYRHAYELTQGFSATDPDTLAGAIAAQSTVLLIFRLLLGFTPQEFATSTRLVAKRQDLKALSSGRIKSLEAGSKCTPATARICALVIDEGMRGELFGVPPTGAVQPKIHKPDTLEGWTSVQRYAAEGVPLAIFLHQRHYGGAFRQLLDATSSQRGNLLEDAVEELFQENGISFVRTGAHNQEEIARRFNGSEGRPCLPFWRDWDGPAQRML